MKFKSVKNSGSALLMSLIFAFVIMAMLTGLLYSFRMGLLTTKSIVKNSNEKVLGETYISNVKDDIDFTKSSEYLIGKSKFEIVVDEDDITNFFPKNGNAELYQAQQYTSFNDIYRVYNRGGDNVDLTKNIIYNATTENVYKNYDGDYIPINVPMINIHKMTEYQAKGYRLSDGKILEDYKGFIGFIQIENQQINIFTENAKIGVPIPQGMDSGFKIKVGWNLKKGKWILYLIIYDTNKLFTTNINLEDLLDKEVQGLEEDNQQLGNEIGDWKAVSNGDSTSGSVGGPFIKENIFDVAWYYEDKDSAPQIMLLRKANQKKGSLETLEAYYSTYSTSDMQHKMKLGGKLNIKRELTEDNIKLLVPDFTNNLDANMALIIHPDNNSETLMHISDFNYNEDHRVGKSLDTFMDQESIGKPVIVSKNDETIYIITYEPNKLYRYEYKKGYGSFESLKFGENSLSKEFEFEKDDSEPLSSPKPKRLGKEGEEEQESDEGIQLVIPKFGYLFLFTKNKLMQLNYDFELLQTIDLGDVVSPQILADVDSIKNTVNKIYVQTTGLELKAQEIRDELGDEELPKDENEIDDKSPKDKKQNQTRQSKLEAIKAKKEKNNEDDAEEDEPPKKMYLDSKYLYPLGIVKQKVL